MLHRTPVFEDEGNAKKRGVSLSNSDCSGRNPQRLRLDPVQTIGAGCDYRPTDPRPYACGEWFYFAVEQWNDPNNLPIDGLVVDFIIDGAEVTSVWEVKNTH